MTVFNADDFNQHENVVFAHDDKTGLKAVIAIHNTRLGPSLGGCRMFPYANEQDAVKDALRLSRGMTFKSAIAGLPLGGGKSVIIADPYQDKSDALFHAMGRFVERLGGQYIVAQDSGISVEDLKKVSEKTRHIAGVANAVDSHDRVRTGDPSPATAYGVFVGIKSAVKHKLGAVSLDGVRVAIQGVGNVGFALAKHLHAEGARLFVSDINAQNVDRAVKECGAVAVSNDDIHCLDVDVFSPCALGGAINSETIEKIVAPVIAGSANNQLESVACGERLQKKGILYAPDFVISAGGIIHVQYMRTGRSWAETEEHVSEIGKTLEEVFLRAEQEQKTTAEVADLLAQERLDSGFNLTKEKALGERKVTAR